MQKKGVLFDSKNKEKKGSKKSIPKEQRRSIATLPSPVEQGHTEAIKEDVKKTDESKIKLEKLLKGSGEILIQVKSFFPFDLFPDEITVSLNRVDIIIKQFFQIGNYYYSFPIEDINNVFVSSSIFFAALEIVHKEGVAPVKIKFLKKDKALKTARLIRGLMTAKKQGVDPVLLANLNKNVLIKKLEELGRLEEMK
ncbi:hypothetical protein C4559_05155 [Candidatus Microgenomates bacterium]|nr:MAG: hypothetical protein C4559_05155 [Candidatus Microgenomates bacterium]